MQACPYQDSNKSRIGTRIRQRDPYIYDILEQEIGECKTYRFTTSLDGGCLLMPAFFLSDVSRYHSTPKEHQIMGVRIRKRLICCHAGWSIPRLKSVSHWYKNLTATIIIISFHKNLGNVKRTGLLRDEGCLHGHYPCLFPFYYQQTSFKCQRAAKLWE